MDDTISRQGAINVADKYLDADGCNGSDVAQDIIADLMVLPSAEPLTDVEQRIFLAAMSKEEKVCRKVDKEIDGDISLTHVCHEIERKVKGALWS